MSATPPPLQGGHVVRMLVLAVAAFAGLVALVAGLVTPRAVAMSSRERGLEAVAPPVFGPLTPVVRLASDGYLSHIGVADVTGDGIPDIVGGKSPSGGEKHPLVVLAGNGKGSFRDVTTQVFVGPVP